MKSEQPNWKQMADEKLLLKRIFNTFIMKKMLYWCGRWMCEDRAAVGWCLCSSWSQGRVLLLLK